MGNRLETELAEITRRFVAELVRTLRNASLIDVAGFDAELLSRPTRPAERAAPRAEPSSSAQARGRRPRQTAHHRAELGSRVLAALARAKGPMGVRTLATEVGVAPDLLAAPLRELRAEGRINKHGDKRATTYSAS